ncbi:hypothetical protein BGZ52_006926, partial [Haplosporangium bisporale]
PTTRWWSRIPGKSRPSRRARRRTRCWWRCGGSCWRRQRRRTTRFTTLLQVPVPSLPAC